MIQTSSIIAMVLAGLVCTLYPVVLLVIWRKKTGASAVPFFIGAATFFLFAMVLERLLHTVCILGDNAVSRAIQGSVVLYTLYGGLAAGLFEETGRFVAFKLMKRHDSRETAITYGIGHGGFESLLLVGITMLTCAGMAVIINRNGALPAFLGDANGDVTAALQLMTASSCAIGTYERLVTVLFHIALSVLVFAAARRPGNFWLYPAAILIHACVDFIAVLYQLGIIQSLIFTELFITVYTALTIMFALWVWKKLQVHRTTEEDP